MDHQNEAQAAPETKVLEAFEAFRAANDERLAEIERRQGADILLEEKVDRIGRAIDRLATWSRRPALAPMPGREGGDVLEHKTAFDAYIRTGQGEALRLIEAKALNGAIAPDGGYLLPPDAEAGI
ncbi:MAG: phage major capsid protein, partial [Rhabdaerophilum calidifontis]